MNTFLHSQFGVLEIKMEANFVVSSVIPFFYYMVRSISWCALYYLYIPFMLHLFLLVEMYQLPMLFGSKGLFPINKGWRMMLRLNPD